MKVFISILYAAYFFYVYGMAIATYQVSGRFWIETKQGAFLGVGRVELLEKVKKFGSISRAAKSMKMSYRQAWELIDSMNQHAKKPLVITQTGGQKGGGSSLTVTGEKAIVQFKKMQDAYEKFLNQQTKRFKL
jgi:molybdate transport system regulatory protein